MGKLIIDEVVQLLRDAEIRTDTAYPSGTMQRITEPVATVSLNKADLKARSAEVLVEILAPKECGGYLCQKTALEACKLLEEAGAVCCQERCEFLSRANLFRVPIRAVFRGVARHNELEELPRFTVKAGPLSLSYACGFSAHQVKSGTATPLTDAPWEITVEEFMPWGVEDSLELDERLIWTCAVMGSLSVFRTAPGSSESG